MSSAGGSSLRATLRLGVLLRDELKCIWCGQTMAEALRVEQPMTIDHIKPLSRGGTNTWRNLVACCWRHNCSRQDKLWRDWAPEHWDELDVDNVPALTARIRKHVGRSERHWRQGAWWVRQHPPDWLLAHNALVKRHFEAESLEPNPRERDQAFLASPAGERFLFEVLDIFSSVENREAFLLRDLDPGAGHMPLDDLLRPRGGLSS